MEKYKASRSGYIEKYKVVKETEHFIFYERSFYTGKIRVEREKKETTYYKWLDSHHDAVMYLIEVNKQKIEELHRSIDFYNNEIKNILQLKEF